MLLDLRTIYVSAGSTAIILGSVQLLSYATWRTERWSLWWGLSNALFGLGVLGTAFRDVAPDSLTIVAANVCLLAGALLLHAALREFAGRPVAPLGYAIAVSGTAVLLASWIDPDFFSRRVVLMALLCAGCDALVVREGLRLARDERLSSAWILTGLFGASVPFWLLRAGMAASSELGDALFAQAGAREQWTTLAGTSLLIIRSSTMLLLSAERGRNLLLALARRDPLTGAMNRAGLSNAFSRLRNARKQDLSARRQRISVLVVDLDHFKALNDTHGHAAGDRVLRLFAETARRNLRAQDIVGRPGGDEFALLLPGTRLTEARQAAERLRAAFRTELTALAIEPMPTLSIGAAEGAIDEPIELLMRRADEALYRSKRLGRNRVEASADLAA